MPRSESTKTVDATKAGTPYTAAVEPRNPAWGYFSGKGEVIYNRTVSGDNEDVVNDLVYHFPSGLPFDEPTIVALIYASEVKEEFSEDIKAAANKVVSALGNPTFLSEHNGKLICKDEEKAFFMGRHHRVFAVKTQETRSDNNELYFKNLPFAEWKVGTKVYS